MTGDAEHVETAIIGGGHAGLTMSYSLSQLGLEHVIFERGRVGERWRSERWDSFCFQFPNWTIELPGFKYQCDDPDAFAPGHEVVRFLDGYADFIKAPSALWSYSHVPGASLARRAISDPHSKWND
jgi:putative flavoprotein involved in K+ transport